MGTSARDCGRSWPSEAEESKQVFLKRKKAPQEVVPTTRSRARRATGTTGPTPSFFKGGRKEKSLHVQGLTANGESTPDCLAANQGSSQVASTNPNNMQINNYRGADGGQGQAGGPLLAMGVEVSPTRSRWVWSGWSLSPLQPFSLLGPQPQTSHGQCVPHLPAP